MDPSDKKDPINLDNILLPKKESVSPDTAQRVNAGALLAQEQQAELPKAPAAPVPTPPKKPEGVAQLQTYKGDIESVVRGGASVVSIASAEAERRSNAPLPASAPTTSNHEGGLRWAMIIGGVILLLGAIGAITFVFTRPTSLPVAAAPTAPFLTVDESTLVAVPQGATQETFSTQLQAARQSTHLALGLIEWVAITRTTAAGEAPQLLPASELLSLLAPNAPQSLLRTLEPSYLFGIHSFDENQPFLILQVDSYETAYRGMLDWENTMQGDLSPLFVRTPSPKIKPLEADTSVGSPTSTSVGAASTTPQQVQFVPTNFVDKIVENRDTRAIVNAQGDILLLWTFLGRNIIVITTNEYTLKEILSRINVAPTVPTPGQ